jgi:hypothetical protein
VLPAAIVLFPEAEREKIVHLNASRILGFGLPDEVLLRGESACTREFCKPAIPLSLANSPYCAIHAAYAR